MEFETLEIPVGNMTFTALAAGPAGGRLVLLLHGFPESSWSWRHQLTALADAGYRAVAPDQRGYSAGARPEGKEHYAVPHLVADVLAIADWLGGHEIDLVGHDWGGAVAWQTAGRYGERLRSLTVVSTPHPAAFTKSLRDENADQSQRSGYMQFFQQPDVPEAALLDNDAAGLRNVYASLPAEDAQRYVDLFTQPGAMTAALNWYRAASIGDVRGMGEVTTPTLYVWSDQDAALGREAADATGQHVKGRFRYEILEGVSHWIPEEAADRFNPMLLEHLASVD